MLRKLADPKSEEILGDIKKDLSELKNIKEDLASLKNEVKALVDYLGAPKERDFQEFKRRKLAEDAPAAPAAPAPRPKGKGKK